MHVPPDPRHFVAYMTGPEKTGAIEAKILQGATSPLIRDVAARLVRGLPRGDHVGRIARFHSWVRDAVDYHREPVEIFQPADKTAREGGDCDDLVILLGSLAWAHRYPVRVQPVGHPAGPRHFSVALGFPHSESFHGDEGTTWLWTEASVPAQLGEHPLAAELRLSSGA